MSLNYNSVSVIHGIHRLLVHQGLKIMLKNVTHVIVHFVHYKITLTYYGYKRFWNKINSDGFAVNSLYLSLSLSESLLFYCFTHETIYIYITFYEFSLYKHPNEVKHGNEYRIIWLLWTWYFI